MTKEGQIFLDGNITRLHPAVGGEIIIDVRELAELRKLVGTQAVARFEAAVLGEQSQPDKIISTSYFKK